MTTSYTSLLGLALPVTGELQGTWGDTVNSYITQYLDAAVAGTQTISGSQTAVTLSVTTGSSLSQAGSGATGSSQYQIINCTGNPAGLLTITAPAASKVYLILNSTSTSQSVKIVGTGPTTGVTVISGEKALVAWNGSDFVKVASTAAAGGSNTQVQYNNNGVLAGSSNLTFDGTTLTANALTLTNKLTIANGGTNATATPTAGAVAYGTGSAYAFTAAGTSNQVLISNGAGAPTWANLSGIGVTTFSAGTTGFTPSTATSGAITLAGTLATTNGGTGLTSFSANGVVYASSTSALATSGGLTFDGTTVYTSGAVRGAGAFAFEGNAGGSATGPTLNGGYSAGGTTAFLQGYNFTSSAFIPLTLTGSYIAFGATAEGMRLTSTGLGIGTSSPGGKLDIYQNSARYVRAYPSSGLADFEVVTNNNVQPVFAVKGTGTADLIRAYAGATQAFTLDSSGNLGLGVTPSAWSGDKAFQLTGNSVLAGGTNVGTIIGQNMYFDGSVYKYIASAAANMLQFSSGEYRFRQAASGTAGNTISFTQAMTLDASGRLLVGPTSDISAGGYFGAGQFKGSYPAIVLNGTEASARQYQIGENAGALTFYDATGGTGGERARIDSSGNLLVGTTTASAKNYTAQPTNAVGLGVETSGGSFTSSAFQTGVYGTAAGTGFRHIQCLNSAAAAVFQILGNGNALNTNGSYGTISDRKMKTDIVDAGSQWADIKAVRFRKFKMKDDPSGLLQLGVVAQELEETSPGLVDETIDRDQEGNDLGTTTKSVKTSVLLMKAAVALQEAMARIEKLEAEVSALKGA